MNACGKLGKHEGNVLVAQSEVKCKNVCEVGTVSKISDCQLEGPGFSRRPGRRLNFG